MRISHNKQFLPATNPVTADTRVTQLDRAGGEWWR